jgi:hypothetical protein
MHLCRSWVVFGLWAAASLSPLSGQAMVVYKWTDAQGVVHFSDQPVDGAEKIITSSGSNHNGVLSTPAPAAPSADKPKSKDSLANATISIASPGSQQTFTGNEPVQVRLSVSPALKPSMQIIWSLNGAQVQNQAPDAVEFALTDLARGTYTIEATVTDVATGESKSADPVTFNVMRPSLLSPQHK